MNEKGNKCPCCFAPVEGPKVKFARIEIRTEQPVELTGTLCQCGYIVSTRWEKVRKLLIK